MLIAYFYKSFFIKHTKFLYFNNLLLLIIVLLFGIKINGSKCWLIIGPFSFQPSEFIKIILIFLFAHILEKYQEKHSLKEEFKMLCTLLIYILLPSILIFLEPDTGIILTFISIIIAMIIYRGLNKKWIFITILFSITIFFLGLFSYYNKINLYDNIMSNNFFYRLDRIINWTQGNGYHLENSLIVIASSGLKGFGLSNIPLYYPEAATDFIFTTINANFGFIGSFIIIILIIIFDITILSFCNKKASLYDQYLLIGFTASIFYQQFQNIGMTIGLLPITGITLPFISYGGTSLLSYMFSLGIILKIATDNKKYVNLVRQ